MGTGARSAVLDALLATVLLSAAFYFARVVLEPIAFALFAIALVWPLLKALEARMPNAIALLLTILVTLVGFLMFVSAIVWSTGDVVHWILGNLARFQSLYVRVTQWLEGHGIFVAEWAGQYDVRTFAGLLQQIAMAVNSFIGFCAVVFLLLTFGMTELAYYEKRFDELEPKLGWKMSQVANEIGSKIRKYMLIRTIASIATGFAVFAYSLSVGLDLAIAWGVISFVLNYIPYIGTLVAIILPVIFATVQFVIVADAGDRFRWAIRHPIRDRQLSRADDRRQGPLGFAFRDAGRIFLLGISMGNARCLHRPSYDDRAHYAVRAEFIHPLDREAVIAVLQRDLAAA